MVYNRFSMIFNYFIGFFGTFFYLVSFLFLKYRFNKGRLILNDKFTLIFVHCLNNFFYIFTFKTFYENNDNSENSEKRFLIPELIVFFLNILEYYYLNKQAYKFIFGNDLFDCDVYFEFDYFWIFHFFFIIITFPYQIFNDDIIYSLKYIKICLLLIFIITYYTFIDNRMREIIELFDEKLESSNTYLAIHIPNIKTIDLYEIYYRLYNLIFGNLIMCIIISTLLIIINVLDENTYYGSFIKNIYFILYEVNFFSLSLYLIYVLYIFYTFNEKPRKIQIVDENIINLEEEKDELEEEENEEENEEEYEEEENEDNYENKNSEKESINSNKNQNYELQDYQF